jgi:hypothetical protein
MIEVVDNFLSPSYFKCLQSMVCSENFPWFFRANVTNNLNSDNGSIGFDNSLLTEYPNVKLCNTEQAKMTLPALYNIQDYVECDYALKARYDMTLYNPENYIHPPHIDMEIDYFISTILYMNDSDGDTIIYDQVSYTSKIDPNIKLSVKKSIEPKANRLLIFDGHCIHTGHSPSKTKNRILLNSNYGKHFFGEQT